MKTSLNVFLVGCGRIARKHVDAIKQLNNPGIALKAICDVSESAMQSLNTPEDVFKTTDYMDSKILKDVNLCVIATESGSHFSIAKGLLERGQNVLIEKPVTLKLSDTHELISTAQKYGRKIYVVKQNRYNLPVEKVRNAFESNLLGKLNIGTVRVRWKRDQTYYDQAPWRGTWSSDGGVITNQAIHHIDLLQWFMGEVVEVYAYSKTFGVHIETEDTLVAILKFKSGALGTIEATTALRPKNIEGSLSLIGSQGSAEIGGFAVNELLHLNLNDGSEWQKKDIIATKDTSDVYGSGHLKVYHEVYKSLNGAPNTAVEASEAIKSLKLIHMIYRSIETGKPVQADQAEMIESVLLGN